MMKDAYRESEDDFQKAIIDYAKLMGWRIHHSRPGWTSKGWRTSIQGHPGFPDLEMVRRLADGETVAIMAELKSKYGKLSKEQATWLDILKEVKGLFTFLWRPTDWDDIVTILQARGLSDIIRICTKNVWYAKNLSK